MIRQRNLLLASALVLSSGLVHAQKLSGKQKRSVKRLKNHIGYLASDDLEGRATGTEGEKKSAEYIAEQFKKLKLDPMGENGYFQTFNITTLRIADASSTFNLGGKDLKLFADYYPLAYSANHAELSSAVVDCGFGIDNEDRNDYEKSDVKGKVALINVGSPDGVHPHSKFVAWHGIQIRVDKAIENGARGVIFYRTDEGTKEPEGALSLTMTPSNVPVVFITRMLSETRDMGFASINLKILTDEDTGYNVIGFNDNKAENTIVIGAHHDHLGHGQHGSSRELEHPNDIHNGADDNASGTAALFELAKALKCSKKWNKNNNYLFIAFSGEELGLIGSKYFVSHPTVDLKKVNYMINMDMVGMLNEEKSLIINGVGTSPSFAQTIADMEESKVGIDKVTQSESGVGPSDHTSFYLEGIPAVHYFTGAHEHYHKPSDDVENLNFQGEVFVIGYILNMIRELNDNGRLEFTKTKDDSGDGKKRTKLAVTLGVLPSYDYDGEGLGIDGVVEGKPAQKAGLRAKDVIISVAGRNIVDIYDYMEAMGELKPGDKATVGILRDGKPMTVEVQF